LFFFIEITHVVLSTQSVLDVLATRSQAPTLELVELPTKEGKHRENFA
jgi:hypothetical protein